MNNYESIEITVRDGNFKKIETHKWNIIDWERLEKTWTYLRKKYGTLYKKFLEPKSDSWITE